MRMTPQPRVLLIVDAIPNTICWEAIDEIRGRNNCAEVHGADVDPVLRLHLVALLIEVVSQVASMLASVYSDGPPVGSAPSAVLDTLFAARDEFGVGLANSQSFHGCSLCC